MFSIRRLFLHFNTTKCNLKISTSNSACLLSPHHIISIAPSLVSYKCASMPFFPSHVLKTFSLLR